MQKEFFQLEKIINEICSDGPVYYLTNIGNYGDSLIRYGTLKFLRDINIDFQEISGGLNQIEKLIEDIETKSRHGTLIYGGGGAWCKLWNQSPLLLERIRLYFKEVIVLPSSFQGEFYFPNVKFFCRDFFQSRTFMPHSIFCHDMAFYIGKIICQKGNGKGYLFRTDKESLGKYELHKENFDISLEGDHNTPIYNFINTIAKYEIIYTDRLHVAIIACLLGKKLHFYPGAYFKNEAVYLSSIKGYFRRVHFHK